MFKSFKIFSVILPLTLCWGSSLIFGEPLQPIIRIKGIGEMKN